jgi:hypothetical protein
MSSEERLEQLDDLHLLQQQLSVAQREELEALLALSSYTRAHGADLRRYEDLTEALITARERHQRIYSEWRALATRALGDF